MRGNKTRRADQTAVDAQFVLTANIFAILLSTRGNRLSKNDIDRSRRFSARKRRIVRHGTQSKHTTCIRKLTKIPSAFTGQEDKLDAPFVVRSYVGICVVHHRIASARNGCQGKRASSDVAFYCILGRFESI